MKKKTVEINDKKYLLQGIPFRSYMEIIDRNTNKNGILMKSTYIAELFKHVVIEPKIRMEDFDEDYETAMELVDEIESFLTTRGTQSEDEGKGEE